MKIFNFYEKSNSSYLCVPGFRRKWIFEVISDNIEFIKIYEGLQ